MTVDLFVEDEWQWRGPLSTFFESNHYSPEECQKAEEEIQQSGQHVGGGGAMITFIVKEWSPDI